MKNKFLELNTHIREENRESAVKEALRLLDSKETSIIELYEDALAPSLHEIDCQDGDNECIWKEHVKTAIVRTIVELCYPYVLQESKKTKPKGKKTLVVCPTEEYHEIGAKMAHDFFLISGYNSTFIGANTPLQVILNAVEFTTPNYIAISVTNYYNIVHAKRIVKAIKAVNDKVVILAGGQAFKDQYSLAAVGADFHVTSFESIQKL